MTGFLVPDHFVVNIPSRTDMNVASIVWGISWGFAIFGAAKAAKQTSRVWRRKKTITAYVAMIWIELIASSAIGILSWLYLWGTIETSFTIFFIILCLWVFQVQCVIQIIINRIALLVRNQTHINRMKWGLAGVLSLINISVFCIWIPAHLQISDTFIRVNEIWDRIEKVIFCIIDLGLNIYFIRLVHSKLISNGLTKYNRLFQYNVAMIAISLSLDIILIGVMSLGGGYVYIQFHPLVYLIKLYIEMNMADLIAKIVRDEHGSYASGSGSYGKTNEGGTGKADPRGLRMHTFVTANRDGPADRTSVEDPAKDGIHRTIETRVIHESKPDDDAESRSSSTTELQKKYGVC